MNTEQCYQVMSDRRRREMGYWSQANRNKPKQVPPEQPKCARCGQPIPPGSLPYLSTGEGFICKACHDKKWKLGSYKK